MFYKLIPDPEGDYISADGSRFLVAAARRVRSAQGLNVGYVEFPSLAAALEHWGLRLLPR